MESILAQQGIKSHEIIVVNDGSRDGCDKIVAEYARRFPEVRLISQENAGVSTARNLGIDNASGEYITFVDADDQVGINYASVAPYFSSPQAQSKEIGNMLYSIVQPYNMSDLKYGFDDRYFSRMLECARTNDADVALAGKFTVNHDMRSIKRHVYHTAHTYSVSPDETAVLLKQATGRENANFALYRTEMLNRKGLRFIPEIHLDEDILFCMQAILNSKKVSTVPGATYLYNRHMGTLSNFTDALQTEMKYAIANIQRYSVLLYDLNEKMPDSPAFNNLMREFSTKGIASPLSYEFPSMCYDCPHEKCTGCYMRENKMAKVKENLEIYVPSVLKSKQR